MAKPGIRIEPPYNPLAKENLGKSVADALLERDLGPLPPAERFIAAGVYAVYYNGPFKAYAPLIEQNRNAARRGLAERPIYIGKAVPAGARKGGFGLGATPGMVLYNRLSEHADSIRDAQSTLKVDHFRCRYIAVDDIWIPLGESMLIEMFSPVWNKLLDGFGNHDPGKGRYEQQRSFWDTVHPGRSWAEKCGPNTVKTREELLEACRHFLQGKQVDPNVLKPSSSEDEDPET
ncbi:MAG TPA: Eco29kI family restriction endonuclease [Terriglobia bacterium]|nr:Eco29kI family restriction endonuclease [Terriglobia bacterium]